MIALIVVIGCGFIAAEHWWPAAALPRVRAWYPRVILVNVLQAGIVVLIGALWDGASGSRSLLRLADHVGPVWQGVAAYLLATVVFYCTYDNAGAVESHCGFSSEREERVADMLAFRDVHDRAIAVSSPLHLAPTCIGCRKRWACNALRSGS
jgi:hypothetical protein